MTPGILTTRILVFVALALPAALSIWALAVADLMSVSTYAAIAALVIAFGAVTVTSVRNGGATGSLGQLLYETEHPARATARAPRDRSGR
jgi:hypothetical protein